MIPQDSTTNKFSAKDTYSELDWVPQDVVKWQGIRGEFCTGVSAGAYGLQLPGDAVNHIES